MNRAVRTLLVGAAVAVTSVAGLSAASATPRHHHRHHHQPTTCSGASWTSPGTLGSGTYYGLEVSGVCLVQAGADITIKGDVTIDTAASLVAINSQTMQIDGDISVGRAAILGLGCTAGLGCDGTNNNPPSADTVNGDITARGALAMYLNGDTIHGDVTFRWGGWGPMCTDPNADDPTDPLGHDLVVKDNTIRGEVDLSGWSGCWTGFIRNAVHGDVRIANNYANPANVITDVTPNVNQGLDSTEVIANTISGDLTCYANTPAAQFGDGLEGQPAGYGPNTVGGRARGECASLLALP
jgi:hypothetical protein